MSANTYDRIREDITSGALEPGAPLAELTMASRYGTSRTPIREALRRLEQDGLVERSETGGMRVRVRSSEEILEIYDVRVLLEGAAASWAADRRTDLDLARIHRAHREMLDIDPSDETGMAASNRRFHEAIWAAGHNAALLDLLQRLNSHLVRYPATTLTWDGRWDAVLKEHAQMIDAIERGDGTGAADIAEEHMRAARQIRLLITSNGA